MLARHNLRPVFVPAQEENWIYKDGKFMGMAPVGSTIRHSFIPPPLHYLQLFLHGKFLWMLDLRDWASLFNVWLGLIMAVGIDPFAENQPMEGLTLGDVTKKWSPALVLFLGLARNGLSSHPDECLFQGLLRSCVFIHCYAAMRGCFLICQDGGTKICEPLSAKVNELGGRRS